MHFSFKQLQHLVLLADERHFARAAERAALSQSAFSRSIQMLEFGVGMRLFDRDLKHVHPTQIGERVIDRARSLLAGASDLERELTLLSAGDLGNIALGAGALAGAVVLPGPLARMRQGHPSVRVDVEVIESNALLDKLLRAGLDFFVGEYSDVPRTEEIHIDVLGRMDAYFFCRAGHALTAKAIVDMGELVAYRLASVHVPDSVLRAFVQRFQAGECVAPELSLQCGSLTILRDYVLGSDAILLSAERPFRVEVEQGLLVPLRVRGLDVVGVSERTPAASACLGLVRMAGRTPTPASQLLMDMIRDEARGALVAVP